MNRTVEPIPSTVPLLPKQLIPSLPSTPSVLVRLAIDDIQWCLDNDIGIDMKSWMLSYNGRCKVCLAGAVLCRSLGQSFPVVEANAPDLRHQHLRHQQSVWDRQTPEVQRAMTFLDAVRVGLLVAALTRDGNRCDRPFYEGVVPNSIPESITMFGFNYGMDDVALNCLRQAADIYEAAGL